MDETKMCIVGKRGGMPRWVNWCLYEVNCEVILTVSNSEKLLDETQMCMVGKNEEGC